MRILFVSDTYYPHLNGVYYFVARIGPLLQQKGHDVAVIAPSESTHSTLKKIDGMDVYGIPSLPILYYPNVRFAIPFFLKSKINEVLIEFKPDIIHIQDHFALSKATIRLANKSGIPIIGTNHFMTENLTSLIRGAKWKTKLSDLLWSRFSQTYNQLSLVTTPSEMAANLIRPKLSVEVIPISSGIDLSFFTPSGDTQQTREKYRVPDKPVLLYVGRLDPEKKIEELLYAVAQASKKIDFCFVIVGKGLRKLALEKLSQELGIADRVIFTGFIPEADLPDMYRLGRCFIIASTAELLSLSTLQAMASGLPVIAVNAGALGEIVHDQVNGFLFDTGDRQTIVESISKIFADEKLALGMSEKSLAFVAKHDINRTVASFEKIYQNKSRMIRPSENISVASAASN